MSWSLVVEYEIRPGVADRDHPALERDERVRRRVAARPRSSAVCRTERIRAEVVLEVGDEQLLVLLLVMQAQLDHRGDWTEVGSALEQGSDRLVDVRAIREDLGDGRPRQRPSRDSLELRTGAVVVRVEQHRVTLVQRPVRGVAT